MSISREQLEKLSKITRIEIRDEEYDLYLNLTNSDLEGVSDLLKVNTDGYENLINPYDMVLRQNADEVGDGNKGEELMKNAPQSLYNYFVVPKIIKKEKK